MGSGSDAVTGCKSHNLTRHYTKSQLIGSILEIKNKFANHYAVVVEVQDDDVFIVHLTEDGTVTRRNANTTSTGRNVMIYNVYDGELKPFAPDVIVKRAMSKIGTHKYSLLYMNCGHFATWCRYGEYRLIQHGFDFNEKTKEMNVRTAVKEIGDKEVNISVGEIKEKWNLKFDDDGVNLGLSAQARGVTSTLGPVKGTLGTAEGGMGFKVAEDGVEAGVKLSARVSALSVGRASVEVGPSLDTGIKAGEDGVGLSLAGFGFEIGKKTHVSLFGLKVGFDFS
uniref:LRAT domain-containing protein n=1 Tax=Panagrellus redivivus TaxID=6233 RepID=A0A7E4W933_PANRE